MQNSIMEMKDIMLQKIEQIDTENMKNISKNNRWVKLRNHIG